MEGDFSKLWDEGHNVLLELLCLQAGKSFLGGNFAWIFLETWEFLHHFNII